jgi:hypothetical protein
VKAAFENEDRERSLFHLFFGHSLFDGMLVWTNAELAQRGKQVINKDKLMAYVGLEVACHVSCSNQQHKTILGDETIQWPH